ncbi:hypothetical protein PoB_004937100 [Plakobranchus ocellatus]|uniref:Uncharacterized protein n=1 Tax=Plakobranchus ocellatus TaxID=259542 RepID=A0AAV4BQW4_9GAST|nr:hypothetical protein PoB_004937100 [Plakobranchus ocellatus]
MAHELVVLSNIQVAETLIDQRNLTLSWDATTLDSVHLNEIHISMPGQALCVDIRRLPGGTSTDYLQHISDALFNTASTYARYKGLPEAATALKLQKDISNTLTDQAAVNHATVMKLQNLFDSQLLEMNCNVHVLDGFATAPRQALKEADRKAGIQSAFRGEFRTVLCIAAVSKLR